MSLSVMSYITVRAFGAVRDIIGYEMIRIEIARNQTVACTIESILTKYPRLSDTLLDQQTGNLKSTIKVLLNGKNMEMPRDAKKKVREGEVLTILPPVGGG